VPLVCTVLIADSLAPMAEPAFTLRLNGNGVELTTNVGLLVAENEQVTWDVGQVPAFVTGETRQLRVEVENTGNLPLQRQLRVEAPDGWTASVDGDDIVSLEVGQSVLVRLDVRADLPGEGELSVLLSESPATDAVLSIAVSATGEPVGTSSSSGLTGATAAGAAVLAILVLLGVAVVRRRTPEVPQAVPTPMVGTPTLKPVPAVPVVAPVVAPAAAPAATPAPMCWACRAPVTHAAVGCPSCGARYHGAASPGCNAGRLTTCNNCGAAASTFIQA